MTTWGAELEFPDLSIINQNITSKERAESLNKTCLAVEKDGPVTYKLTLDNGKIKHGEGIWTPEIVTSPFQDVCNLNQKIIKKLLSDPIGYKNYKWGAQLSVKDVASCNIQLTVGFKNPSFYRYLLYFSFFGDKTDIERDLKTRLGYQDSTAPINKTAFDNYFYLGQTPPDKELQIMMEILALMLCGAPYHIDDLWAGNKALLSTMPRTLFIDPMFNLLSFENLIVVGDRLKAPVLERYASGEYHRDIWFNIVGPLTCQDLLCSLSTENRASFLQKKFGDYLDASLIPSERLIVEKKYKETFKKAVTEDQKEHHDKYKDIFFNDSYVISQANFFDNILANMYKYDWISFPPCSSPKEPMGYIDREVSGDHLPFIFELRRFKKWWKYWRSSNASEFMATKKGNPTFNENFCRRLSNLTGFLSKIEHAGLSKEEFDSEVNKIYTL